MHTCRTAPAHHIMPMRGASAAARAQTWIPCLNAPSRPPPQPIIAHLSLACEVKGTAGAFACWRAQFPAAATAGRARAEELVRRMRRAGRAARLAAAGRCARPSARPLRCCCCLQRWLKERHGGCRGRARARALTLLRPCPHRCAARRLHGFNGFNGFRHRGLRLGQQLLLAAALLSSSSSATAGRRRRPIIPTAAAAAAGACLHAGRRVRPCL